MAVICAVPLSGTIGVFANSLMVALLGAVSGTLSHAPRSDAPANTTTMVAAPSAADEDTWDAQV